MKRKTKQNQETMQFRRTFMGGLAVLMLILSLLSITQTQQVDAHQEDMSINFDKMNYYLIQELSQISESEKIEVVVKCSSPKTDYSESEKIEVVVRKLITPL
jgi:hypothetical protein